MEDHLREVLTRGAQRHIRGGEAPRDALAAIADTGGEPESQDSSYFKFALVSSLFFGCANYIIPPYLSYFLMVYSGNC